MRSLLAAGLVLILLTACGRSADNSSGSGKTKIVHRFSDVRLATVSGMDPEGTLCLDSGKLIRMPRLQGAARQAFIDKNKIDAFIFPNDQDFLVTLPAGEPGQVVIVPQAADAWDKLAAPDVLWLVDQMARGPQPAGVTSSHKEPVVAVFRSGRGVVGILRVTGKVDAKGGGNRVTIEEKVVTKEPPATQAK